MKKILVISKCPTHPTVAGNSSWLLSLVKTFQSYGHVIHFLYVAEPAFHKINDFHERNISMMKMFYGDGYFSVYKIPRIEKIKISIFQFINMNLRKGYTNVDTLYPKGLKKFVNQLNKQELFDVCVINYFYLSKLFTNIDIPIKAIATHDCFAYKEKKVHSSCLSLTASNEAKAMQRCPHIFALQKEEASYFKIISPLSSVYCIYNKVEHRPTSLSKTRNILFLSGDNTYNYNGITWFLREVFPKLKRTITDVKLILGGNICNKLDEWKKDDSIVMHGFVNQLDAFYNLGDVIINPVYQGTGLKIKTIESISYEKITIVRRHSIEGIYDVGTCPLFVSDNPKEWVDYISFVFNHEEEIVKNKRLCNNYITAMNSFVDSELHRFFSTK